jgi:hypothetical protein
MLNSKPIFPLAFVSLLAFVAPGCGGSGPADVGEECDPAEQTGCVEGLVCEAVEGAKAACFAPLSFLGKVFNALDNKPIAGARVLARDANDVAISTSAISGADGTYRLNVPTKRDAKGVPLGLQVTLRADALGFQTFPTAPRVALPIDAATAMGTPLVLKTAATDISLIPLKTTTGLGSIAGKVIADAPGGTLVVAGGSTGIADLKGDYVVFNVPAGSGVAVMGYAAGLQLKPASANVVASMQTPGINLSSTGKATAAVSGSIQIVNGGIGNVTSVVLAVEETFNMTAARGEVPKGLRIGGVTGAFTIPAVPDGKYVVLAAFENDDLVRDPDMSIGGTQIVHITVAGADQMLADSFKVTGALAVVSPGADKQEVVSGMPTFTWADDSSEDHYEVRLFDAFGNNVWENLTVPAVSGSTTVAVPYAGPALLPGMIYQFRALSIKGGGTAISATEDLKGVFVYK